MSKKYDNENPDHVDLLKSFWEINFQGEEFEAVSTRWKSIGFQGDDPSRDFRGGGLTSLQQMIYFANNHPQQYNEIKGASQSYLFATSSINLTHLIIIYFKLNPIDESITPKTIQCEARQYKNFAHLAFLNTDTVNEIYVICCRFLHLTWMKMTQDPAVNLLQFGHALTKTVQFLAVIMSTKYNSLREFVDAAEKRLK